MVARPCLADLSEQAFDKVVPVDERLQSSKGFQAQTSFAKLLSNWIPRLPGFSSPVSPCGTYEGGERDVNGEGTEETASDIERKDASTKNGQLADLNLSVPFQPEISSPKALLQLLGQDWERHKDFSTRSSSQPELMSPSSIGEGPRARRHSDPVSPMLKGASNRWVKCTGKDEPAACTMSPSCSERCRSAKSEASGFLPNSQNEARRRSWCNVRRPAALQLPSSHVVDAQRALRKKRKEIAKSSEPKCERLKKASRRGAEDGKQKPWRFSVRALLRSLPVNLSGLCAQVPGSPAFGCRQTPEGER